MSSAHRALFCKPCATEKTAAETPDRAKVRRIEGKKTQADKRAARKANGTHRPIRSAGFQKRTGPSGLSKDSEHYQRARAIKESEDGIRTIRTEVQNFESRQSGATSVVQERQRSPVARYGRWVRLVKRSMASGRHGRTGRAG